MSNIARKVAQYLLKANAVKLKPNEPFTWASGIRAPIYCDNRKILSFPQFRNEIKHHLSQLAENLGEADVIAGVATAGIPHGILLADLRDLPFIYVRSKPKGHGLQSKVEGFYEKGQRVIVVEDLISTGKSSLEAVESLRSEGLEVLGVIALFSYQLKKSEENFKGAACKLFTLSEYGTLIDVALEQNYINQQELDLLKKWRDDPVNWLEKS
ncbi:MAG: orotate phosphoribosyltransferase [Saprospirales bacterium]|nr:MAG: orotate phosphoribosyltransferase [Saprospirales bacterium]